MNDMSQRRGAAKAVEDISTIASNYDRVALVLQGGGALGAYQAGVYEALAEGGIQTHWIAGVSIGAINGAIIAGNPPKTRIDRLREFWTQATTGGVWPCLGDPAVRLA